MKNTGKSLVLVGTFYLTMLLITMLILRLMYQVARENHMSIIPIEHMQLVILQIVVIALAIFTLLITWLIIVVIRQVKKQTPYEAK